MKEKRYQLRSTTTGLYSKGGTHPSFAKTGKIWRNQGHLTNHLSMLSKYGKETYERYGVEIVVSEVIVTEIDKVSIADWTNGKRSSDTIIPTRTESSVQSSEQFSFADDNLVEDGPRMCSNTTGTDESPDDIIHSQLVNKIIRVMFPEQTDFDKALWRMTGGSRSKSFQLVKEFCENYGIVVTEALFEDVMAQMNGGLEMEWLIE